MRLLKRCLVVAGSIGVLLLGVAAPASAAQREGCLVRPTNFRPQGLTFDESVDTLFYVAKATTTLDCSVFPEEIPVDLVQEAALRVHHDNSCFNASTIDGRLHDQVGGRTLIDGHNGAPGATLDSVGFMGRVLGTIQLDGSGRCVIDFKVRAHGPNGSTLLLHQVGYFDTELLSLSIVSGFLAGETVIRELYGHGTD